VGTYVNKENNRRFHLIAKLSDTANRGLRFLKSTLLRWIKKILNFFRNPLRNSSLLRRALGPKVLFSRYKMGSLSVNKASPPSMIETKKGLDRCKVVVINLPERVDRNTLFREEAKKLGMEGYVFFQAIRDTRGSRGCSLSHAKVLRETEITHGQILMDCEDDCQFLVDRATLDAVIEEFYSNEKLDVLCLAYNTPHKRHQARISDKLLLTENTQTTACYLVKPRFQSHLESVAAASSYMLEKSAISGLFEYDVLWKELQLDFFFAIPDKRMVRQAASYSDIEQKFTNYGV
jgi:glycosyl transferase family 25